MGRLDGKVAIVTGAARGQGEAEARAFVSEGARVVMGDILDEQGHAVAADLGDVAAFVHLDVTSEDSWKTAVGEAVTRFGGLNALVNNAGISLMPKPIADTEVAEYRKVIEVNQIGAFIGIHTAVPAMIGSTAGVAKPSPKMAFGVGRKDEAGVAKPSPKMASGVGRKDEAGGSIVNVSSVNGFVGAAGIAGYVSSKFALRGLTKTAALELAGFGIRVNSIHPGPIDTDMVQPQSWGGYDMRPALAKVVPAGRLGTPAEVAELVVWLTSDASAYCTGAEFVIDGGYLAGPLTFGMD